MLPDLSDKKLNIALGTTALEHGLRTGSLDGIGIYAQALLAHLKQKLTVEEVAFRRIGEKKDISRHFFSEKALFESSVIRTAITGLPFQGHFKNKVQLFHAPDHFIPKMRDVPVIATLMDPVPIMRPDWVSSRFRKIKNTLFCRSAQWASHYITISQAVVPDLVRYFRIPEEKITPIHLGVNLHDFLLLSEEVKQKTLDKFQLKSDFFLFIGTLQPRKNVKRILDAFERLPLEMQQAHPLVIVGREGWSFDEEIKQLKKLMDLGVAHWVGYVSLEDKAALLQAARAFVFPSLYEGFGLPVLEAFASRAPVITSNVSSLPEIAKDAAMLVDPLDIEALSDAMKMAVEKPEYFKPLVEKGYLRASEMTWAHCAEKTIQVYYAFISS